MHTKNDIASSRNHIGRSASETSPARALRIIVACEATGTMRRALRKYGHDAWSCDLRSAEDESPFHFQGNIFDYLGDGLGFYHENPFRWDMMIAHPECRFMANCGAKHLYIGGKKENGPDLERWEKMREGAEFFRRLWNVPIPRKVFENPKMMGHALNIIGIQPTHKGLQPWMFGDKETKEIWLWTEGVPALEPTDIVGPPPSDPIERRSWERVWRMPPTKNPEDRRMERSRFFPGVADAIALQLAGDARKAVAA